MIPAAKLSKCKGVVNYIQCLQQVLEQPPCVALTVGNKDRGLVATAAATDGTQLFAEQPLHVVVSEGNDRVSAVDVYYCNSSSTFNFVPPPILMLKDPSCDIDWCQPTHVGERCDGFCAGCIQCRQLAHARDCQRYVRILIKTEAMGVLMLYPPSPALSSSSSRDVFKRKEVWLSGALSCVHSTSHVMLLIGAF